MGRGALKAALFASIVVGLGLFTARARGQTSIGVRASSCSDVPWSRDAWVSLLRVELTADRIDITTLAEASNAEMEVAIDALPCGADAETAVLTFTFGGTSRERNVRLADVDLVARARVLAIAMAELIRSSLAAAKAKAPPPLPAPPPADVAVPVRPEFTANAPARARMGSHFALALSGEARAFARVSPVLFGARIGAQGPLASWCALSVDGGALFGVTHDALGDVDERLVSVGVNLMGKGGSESVEFGVGPRLELGVAWFHGSARDPSTIASSASSPVVLFALTSFVSFAIKGAMSGLVAIDAGTSLFGYGARADDRQVAALDGPLLSLRIGLAWSPLGDSASSSTSR